MVFNRRNDALRCELCSLHCDEYGLCGACQEMIERLVTVTPESLLLQTLLPVVTPSVEERIASGEISVPFVLG